MRYRVLCADPPWSFGDKLPGDSRGAEKNYSVMSIEDICAFAIPEMEADSLLFMWRVASQQEEALRVVRAWGFIPKTEIVWQKLTKTGKKHFGMGRIVRASHETCIVAKRGHGAPILDKGIRSTFEAPVGIHSEKPEFFYREIVEKLADGPYCELFARRPRSGWTCLGNEMPAEVAA